MTDDTTVATPAKKTAARKTASSRATKTAEPTAPEKDLIDQVAETLALAEDSPERTRLAAYLESLPTGEQKPRNVIEAMVAVMRKVSHVSKNEQNRQQGFNFRGIDATVNALGPAMREVGLIVMPEIVNYSHGEVEVGQNRTKQAHVEVKVRYRFLFSNAEGNLSSESVLVPGESMDSGDKATAKAMSVAMRIALLQSFALPTTDPDPDAYAYQRSNAPTRTENDVIAAVSWAAEQGDTADAFNVVRNQIGAELFSIQISYKDGTTKRADKYLDEAEAEVTRVRAERARAQQDADAEGAPAQAESAQPAQEAPAQSAQTEPAQAEPARAPEAAPTEEGDPRKRLTLEELQYQADVLEVAYSEYIKPILSNPEDKDSIVWLQATNYLMGQRPQVIAVLQQKGRSSEAAALEAVIKAPFVSVEQITAATAPADAQEPVGAE